MAPSWQIWILEGVLQVHFYSEMVTNTLIYYAYNQNVIFSKTIAIKKKIKFWPLIASIKR